MPQGFASAAYLDSIQSEEQKQRDEEDMRSVQELLMSAAGKSEQLARESIRQVFFEPNQPLYTKPFKEIFQGKRAEGEDQYTSEEFRRDLYDKLGVEQPDRVEKDWSGTQKVAADFATDLIFNVDNLILGLPGKILGSTGKIGAEALKSAKITEKSKMLRALSKANPITIGRMTTGGVVGAMMTQEDDDAIEVLKKVGIGAGLGVMFSPGAGQLLSGISKVTDNTVDAFNRAVRPEFYRAQQRLLKDIPLDERLGLGSDVGIKNLTNLAGKNEREVLQRAHFYRKGLEEIEDGLIGNDVEIFDNLRLQAAGATKKYREKYYKKLKSKLTADGRKLTGPEKHALLNEATRRANSVIGKKMIPIIHAADPTGKVVKAMDDFVKFNRGKVEEYNKLVPKHKNPYLVGFDYYMPGVTPDLGAVPERLMRVKGGFKRARGTLEPDLSSMTRGQIRDLAAQRYSKAFLDGQERTARMLLASLNNMPLASSTGGKVGRIMLDSFDRFNRLIVAGQLFATHMWVATNYLDNLGRAFMVGGLGTALRAAGGGAFGIATTAARVSVENKIVQDAAKLLADKGVPIVKPTVDLMGRALDRLSRSNLVGEILDATHPMAVGKGKYDNDILELAHITGVIDTDKARQFLQHWDNYGGVRTTLNTEKTLPKIFEGLDHAIDKSGGAAEAALKTARAGGKVVHTLTSGVTNFLTDTMARIGSANEAYTRLVTFEKVYKSLLDEIPGAYKQVKKIGLANAYQQGFYVEHANRAAQIVEDTFFDYSKVTAFERAVGKRVMPYWTFYTRNAHFWLKNLTDPQKIGRVMKNARYLKAQGREPNKKERQYMAKFSLREGARILPKAPDGRTVTLNMPGASLFDAIGDTAGLATVFGKLTGAMPKGVTSERIKMTEKISPMLKAAIELTTGKNLMTGKPILPSDDPEKRTRVFSDALTTKALWETWPLSWVPYETKIYVDRKGKTYFVEDDSDAMMIVVRRNLLPLRMMDSYMGYKADVKSGKRTPLEAGIHYWTPFSVRPYTMEEKIKKIKRGISKKKSAIKRKAGMKEINLDDDKGGPEENVVSPGAHISESIVPKVDDAQLSGNEQMRFFLLWKEIPGNENKTMADYLREQGWKYSKIGEPSLMDRVFQDSGASPDEVEKFQIDMERLDREAREMEEERRKRKKEQRELELDRKLRETLEIPLLEPLKEWR